MNPRKANEKYVKTKFLEDIKTHEMLIIKDDGVHRHIKFKKSDCSSYWFELVTWPGYLCIAGDMGSYVFCRSHDMFGFFVDQKEQDLKINPGYWAEKCQAHSGIKEFSRDLFKRAVVSDFKTGFIERCPRPKRDKIVECWKKIKEDILSCDENTHSAFDAVYSFRFEKFDFVDFFDHDVEDYTYRYLWCLFAIVWGIKMYKGKK
jgi:hypothetical protein